MTEIAADTGFEAAALACLDHVARFAKSLTREESDADDLVQETYLRAFRSRHTFQPDGDMRRWLFTIPACFAGDDYCRIPWCSSGVTPDCSRPPHHEVHHEHDIAAARPGHSGVRL